jgi:hypothetical protein
MTSMSIHEYGVAPDEVQCMFCDEGNISGFYWLSGEMLRIVMELPLVSGSFA